MCDAQVQRLGRQRLHNCFAIRNELGRIRLAVINRPRKQLLSELAGPIQQLGRQYRGLGSERMGQCYYAWPSIFLRELPPVFDALVQGGLGGAGNFWPGISHSSDNDLQPLVIFTRQAMNVLGSVVFRKPRDRVLMFRGESGDGPRMELAATCQPTKPTAATNSTTSRRRLNERFMASILAHETSYELRADYRAESAIGEDQPVNASFKNRPVSLPSRAANSSGVPVAIR